MKKLFRDYKKSLKGVEVEENLDLLIYRPLAFAIAKGVQPFPVTPNQLTIIALLLGLGSGISLAQGTAIGFLQGGVLLALSNVFDCSDGMLARLKKNGSHLGRIVDGMADYLIGAAVYIGLGFGLMDHYSWAIAWTLAELAGVSAIAHSIIFDYYRNEFLAHAMNEVRSTDSEKREFVQRLAKIKNKKIAGFERFAIRLYLVYLNLQSRNEGKPVKYRAKDYYQKNRVMLRLWSFIGPTTHITVLLIATLMERIEIFLYYVIGFGNIWMFLLWLVQRQINKKLKVA